MGLHQDVIACQNEESFNDCLTKEYLEKIVVNCGCLPLSVKNFSKVKKSNDIKRDRYFTLQKHIQENVCSSHYENDCAVQFSNKNAKETKCIK